MADRPEETREAIAAYLRRVLPDASVDHLRLPYYDDDAFYRIDGGHGLRQVQASFVFLEDHDPDDACDLLDRWHLVEHVGRLAPTECVSITNDGLQTVPLRTSRPS